MSKKENSLLNEIIKIESIEELRPIKDALNLRWKHLTELNVLKFNEGDKVTFQSRKRGCIISGVIGKISNRNKKSVPLLADDGTQWKVSPNVLRYK